MRDAASSITLEEIRAKYKVPSSHAYSSKNYVDKNITLGKLEGSVEVHIQFKCSFCSKLVSSIAVFPSQKGRLEVS